MEENFDATIRFIFGREGNKVHLVKGDRGGLTSAGGLTLKTMKALGIDLDDDGDVDSDDVRLVDAEVVSDVFREYYWDRINGDELPPGLDLMYGDIAWNSGVGTAKRFIREGYKTTEALLARRMRFYHAIVAGDPSQEKFLNGWINRANLAYETAQDCV